MVIFHGYVSLPEGKHHQIIYLLTVIWIYDYIRGDIPYITGATTGGNTHF